MIRINTSKALKNYIEEQINRVLEGQEEYTYIKLKLYGSKNDSKYLDITAEQLEQIKQILLKGEAV